MANETISAVCSALGEGAVGVIRISGENSLSIIKSIFKPKNKKFVEDYQSHRLIYGHVYDKDTIVDEVLCVYMKAPFSYTGEDVVEVQSHGGITIMKKILSLIYLNGATPAEPGEFTKRAFLNGRIDLTQAEAVMSMIRAKSEASLKQAVYQQQGALSKEINKLRDVLKDIIVDVEAIIDYPEEDLEDITTENVVKVIEPLLQGIELLLESAEIGRVIKEGLKTVIIGKPNVGKSSLLNVLSGFEKAIVTDIAGTTRDSIEEQIFIEGIPLVLIDTAGIRKTNDKVEKIGIEKSYAHLSDADLILLLLDGSSGLDEDDINLLNLIKDKSHLILINKDDLPNEVDINFLTKDFDEKDIIKISLLNKNGWDQFNARLKEKVYGERAVLTDGIYVYEARHKKSLQLAKNSLMEAHKAAIEKMPLDCMLVDMKDAFYNLGLITGQSVTDEILHEIFSRFCLGK